MVEDMTVGEAIRRIKEYALHHAVQELPNSARTVEAFEMAITALEVVSKIVTCGECVYWNRDGETFDNDMHDCKNLGGWWKENEFCCDGEKKDYAEVEAIYFSDGTVVRGERKDGKE